MSLLTRHGFLVHFHEMKKIEKVTLIYLLKFYKNKKITLFYYLRLKIELEELTGRNVDLIEDGQLKQFAIPGFDKDKILIYERVNQVWWFP